MKRNALASAAVLALLSVTACSSGAGSATPNPTAPPTPSQLPTATATPSVAPSPISTATRTNPTTKAPPKRSAAPHTPRATPTDPAEISGAIGSVPEGFKLPDEDRAATDDASAFTTSIWRASCPDRLLTLASASKITGSRIKESVGPEHVVGNGLLVFADEAAADAFLAELTDKLSECDVQGPSEEGWRTLQTSAELDGFGDLGVQVRQWSEWDNEGTWTVAPGAGLQYLARKGAYVGLTYEGGEFQGDPADLPELVADAEARLAAILDQV